MLLVNDVLMPGDGDVTSKEGGDYYIGRDGDSGWNNNRDYRNNNDGNEYITKIKIVTIVCHSCYNKGGRW